MALRCTGGQSAQAKEAEDEFRAAQSAQRTKVEEQITRARTSAEQSSDALRSALATLLVTGAHLTRMHQSRPSLVVADAKAADRRPTWLRPSRRPAHSRR